MGRWLVRRLIITLVTFIGITMLVFVLMRLAPVSPVDLMLFNHAPVRAACRRPTSRPCTTGSPGSWGSISRSRSSTSSG